MAFTSLLRGTTNSTDGGDLVEELTYKSLANAMLRCHDNNHYQACVVFKYRQSLEEFINELKEMSFEDGVYLEIDFDPYRMTKTGLLTFRGNSSIRFVAMDDFSSRGHKYNELLYEAGMDMGYVYTELYPLLINYKAVDGSPYATELDVKPFDAELMEYLDGFKIIKEE